MATKSKPKTTQERMEALRDELVKADTVNHPPHYETGKFECIEVMREVFGDYAVMDFCLCNAFKYLYRCKRKNGVEDVEKAEWYCRKYAELRKRHEADGKRTGNL